MLNPRFEKWPDDKLVLLKNNYDKSYSDLEKLLGKSQRAIKHKVGQLGLKRSERRRWSESELLTLKQNPEKSAKELAVILSRSEYQVAIRLRLVRGTANRRFKDDWNLPSIDLAYLLGAYASDGTMTKYMFSFCQVISNNLFVDKVDKSVQLVFGLPTQRVMNGRFMRIESYSTEFAKKIGGKNKGCWIHLINKFIWLNDDKYYWYFISGLYDGDGCLSRSKRDFGTWYDVKMAIKPELSRKWFVESMMSRGFEFHENSWDKNGVCFDVRLIGGQAKVDEFLTMLHSYIPYKANKVIKW